MNTHTKN